MPNAPWEPPQEGIYDDGTPRKTPQDLDLRVAGRSDTTHRSRRMEFAGTGKLAIPRPAEIDSEHITNRFQRI